MSGFDTLYDAQMIAGLTTGKVTPVYVEAASEWLKTTKAKRQMFRSAIKSRDCLIKLGILKSRQM